MEIMLSRKGAAVTATAKSVLVETLAKNYEDSGEGGRWPLTLTNEQGRTSSIAAVLEAAGEKPKKNQKPRVSWRKEMRLSKTSTPFGTQ